MELVEASRNVSPRRQLQMFREAIAPDADCAWALLAMARRFSDDREKLEWVGRAVDAATRKLGEETMSTDGHPFWLDFKTRPDMRVMQLKGQLLINFGRGAEAADVFDELLRRNSSDNQGIWHMQSPLLMELGRPGKMKELVGRHPDVINVVFSMCLMLSALLDGDTGEVERQFVAVSNDNEFTAVITVSPDVARTVRWQNGWSPGLI